METKTHLRKLLKLFFNFEIHLTLFIIVNSVLWMIFLLSNQAGFDSLPLYISIVWFVVLIIHWLVAYEKFRINKKH
jgi:2TM domain